MNIWKKGSASYKFQVVKIKDCPIFDGARSPQLKIFDIIMIVVVVAA